MRLFSPNGVKAAASLARAALATLAFLASPALGQQATDAVAPEASSGASARQAVHAKRHMVVAANPLAAEAGLRVLREGGNAADSNRRSVWRDRVSKCRRA